MRISFVKLRSHGALFQELTEKLVASIQGGKLGKLDGDGWGKDVFDWWFFNLRRGDEDERPMFRAVKRSLEKGPWEWSSVEVHLQYPKDEEHNWYCVRRLSRPKERGGRWEVEKKVVDR